MSRWVISIYLSLLLFLNITWEIGLTYFNWHTFLCNWIAWIDIFNSHFSLLPLPKQVHWNELYFPRQLNSFHSCLTDVGDTWIHRYPNLNSFVALRKAFLRWKRSLFPGLGMLLKMSLHPEVDYFINTFQLQNTKKFEKIIDIN